MSETPAEAKAKEIVSIAKGAADDLLAAAKSARKSEGSDFLGTLRTYFEGNDSILLQHFEDDRQAFAMISESFGQIKEKLDKREQIAIEHAHHFSSMGRELAVMNSFMLELRPMIDEYKESQAFKVSITRRAESISKYAKSIAAFLAAMGIIWGLFKGFLLLIVR